MILLIFLVLTALSFDVVRTIDVGNSKTKAHEISPELTLDTSIKHVENPVPPVSPHYTEGGAIQQKKETTKVILEGQKTNEETTLPSSLGDKKVLETLPESLEKEVASGISNIKPRKGAALPPPPNDPALPVSSIHPLTLNDTSKSNLTTSSIIPSNSKITSPNLKNTTAVPTIKPEKQNLPTEPVHKPLILNAVDGDGIDPVPAAEIKQREGHVRSSKISTANSHPNLVIPVTITVFALPLFAVLGYYALKHGREAWKNRHYRRMDFLLDGMYND